MRGDAAKRLATIRYGQPTPHVCETCEYERNPEADVPVEALCRTWEDTGQKEPGDDSTCPCWEEFDADEYEQRQSECGVCGGSGGGERPMHCTACSGTGVSRSWREAQRQARDEARAEHALEPWERYELAQDRRDRD